MIPIKSLLEKPQLQSGEMTQIDQTKLNHLAAGTNQEKVLIKDLARMPGTMWCGKGWRTDKAQKFGGYAGTDRCCRHHDLGCPLSLEPGQTEYGLFNHLHHTVMHCSCDHRFRSCLRMVNNQAADIVANLFFNILNTKCFVFKMQKVCERANWWGRCVEKREQPVAVWREPVAYTN